MEPYSPFKQDDTSVQISQPLHGQVTVVSSQPVTMTVIDGNVNLPRGVPRDWSTPLCGCFEDIPGCLLGLFCSPCHLACLASDMGEPCCTACCAGLLAMRSHFRGKHNIQGSLINDCCTVYWCGLCASCQLNVNSTA
ncbi:placenta-specific gene 8 protein-like isoform X2 [Amphiura filiformis]|uniref:placenta-specific gene 8 protein-like isoform X2 n=1 Tax=Amphiura filiformis TaxID=82378 RepID=UPI003B2111FD